MEPKPEVKAQYSTYETLFPSLCKWKGLMSEFTKERYIPTEKIMQCCVDKERLLKAIENIGVLSILGGTDDEQILIIQVIKQAQANMKKELNL